MFDLHSNDSAAAENSEMNVLKRNKGMDPSKNSLINSPSFLAGMSHEMRTYMNAIVAFSYLMKENCPGSTESEEYSKQILKSCEQLIGLFDSFLDSAIISTGNSGNDASICRLDNMLDDLFSEFRDTIKKQGTNNLEFVTEVQFSDSSEVIIDKNKVLRAIRSLFENAIITTSSGYIKIGYQYNDEKVTFYVLDSGQGFFKCKEFLHSEDLNESLLIHNDTHIAINVTLAKKLIQLLGGTIWIESNGLSGTGIYFSIPASTVYKPNNTTHKYVNAVIAI